VIAENIDIYLDKKVITKEEVEKIVGSSLDITENKIKEKEIQYLSFHDEMTGLYNRRYFENEIQRLNSSRKLPITILVADLDNLKYVNDNFGHQTGDNYIITAAQMISDSIRDEDIAARIGGDEFALILPDTESSGAQKIYKRIKEKQNKYLRRQIRRCILIKRKIKTSKFWWRLFKS
jgi:diguanylate cyclase (GGDEF)-like protein